MPGSTGTNTGLLAAVPKVTAPVADVTAPAAAELAPAANVAPVAAPVPDMAAPVAEVTAAVPNVVAPVAEVAPAVPNVAAAVAEVAAPVPNVVVPASDVIVAVQDLLSSVTSSVVLLTQVPADLFSLLMPRIAGTEPVVTESALSVGAGLSPAAGDALVAWQSPVPPLAGILSVPSAPQSTTAVSPVDVIAGFTLASHVASSVPETPPPASSGASPRSFFRDIFGQLLVPVAVSLAALAAAALPGVGGLLILNAAGARIGYRQAKFGFALHTSGLARFARPGPIGVVRSGSLVFVRPRGLQDRSLFDEAA